MNNETLEILEYLKKRIDKVLLTKKEVATLLSVSTTTIDNYIKREVNPLSFIKFGKSPKSPIRFHLTSIAIFLYKNKENINEQ